jgi:hypothetical protein
MKTRGRSVREADLIAICGPTVLDNVGYLTPNNHTVLLFPSRWNQIPLTN